MAFWDEPYVVENLKVLSSISTAGSGLKMEIAPGGLQATLGGNRLEVCADVRLAGRGWQGRHQGGALGLRCACCRAPVRARGQGVHSAVGVDARIARS